MSVLALLPAKAIITGTAGASIGGVAFVSSACAFRIDPITSSLLAIAVTVFVWCFFQHLNVFVSEAFQFAAGIAHPLAIAIALGTVMGSLKCPAIANIAALLWFCYVVMGMFQDYDVGAQ